MMRRLTMALLATCLLLVSAAPAFAQEQSPPPWFGGRVEMPEQGFAVTLPDDWEAFDLTSDLYEQARRYVAAGSPDAEEDIVAAIRAFSDQVSGQLVAWSSQYGVCTFDVVPGTVGQLGAKVDRALSVLTTAEGIHVEPRATVDLPVGTAHVVTYRSPGEATTVYIGEASGLVFNILCYGWERPDDSWLSIVETIELLPGGDRPVVIGGRIEVPDAGFAVEVPGDWLAADLSDPDVASQLASTGEAGSWLADALDGHLGASFADRVALGHDMVLWASPADEGPENRQHCEAYVLRTVLTSIAQFYELNSSHFEDDPTQAWEQIDLPAGPAVRTDYQWSPTSFGSDYTLFDGRRFITLSCVQGMPVDGVDEAARRSAWLSIAETFEFLPEE